MTAVTGSYIFYAPEGFQLSYQTSMICGAVVFLAVVAWFLLQLKKNKSNNVDLQKVV
jgi:hypothetical protein